MVSKEQLHDATFETLYYLIDEAIYAASNHGRFAITYSTEYLSDTIVNTLVAHYMALGFNARKWSLNITIRWE